MTDSVTFMELAKRKEEQYVLNASSNAGKKADGRQWYASSMNALEDHIMIRMAAYPINVVVIAHINELEGRRAGIVLYNPAAPGQLGRRCRHGYAELYRAHVSATRRRAALRCRRRPTTLQRGDSSIPAPDGCETITRLWTLMEAEG